MNLTQILEEAVPIMSRRKSEELGNRANYIGSSDVSTCMRRTYLQRQLPLQPSTSTLLKFARGHAAEWLLSRIFDASGIPYDSQVEIQHPTLPLRCHVDFLLYRPDGFEVVEVKSVSALPMEPFEQWLSQVQIQHYLLRLQYPHGRIGGSILAVDLNAGEFRQFGGIEFDEVYANYLYHRALHLLDVLNDQAEACAEPSYLCGHCQFRDDCPSMSLPPVVLPPEIERMAGKYAELNATKSVAEKEMKSIRQELMDFTGPAFKGRSDHFDLTVSTVDGGMTVDSNLLRQQHPQIYNEVLKPRSGYSRLEVKPRKHPPLAKAA